MEMSRKEFVRHQSDVLVLKLGRFIWQMHVVSVILLVALIWTKAPAGPNMMWGGWMGGLAIVQAVICFRGAAVAKKNMPFEPYVLAFDISAIVLALGWVWFVLALIPGGDTEIRNFTGFIIGGAILTVTGTQNLHYPVMAATIALIIGSQCYRLLVDDGNAIGVLSAGMLMIFMLLMLGLGWMLRRFTRRGFSLQWDKAELARKLEEQANTLRIARAEADAANDAKSRFLAQASHDLRQPLHAMGLQLASLSHEEQTPRTQNVMSRIGQSIEVLSKLFNSLLDVTLLDTRQLIPKVAEFNLGALIVEVSDEYCLVAEAENVTIKPIRNDVFINSDTLIVRRILQNLISNAVRHTDGGDVNIYTQKKGKDVFLIVQDTGRGVADVDQERIFEEFKKAGSTSDAAEGLGLGLAIVRRLSQALNVKISFSSKQGEGTRFSIGPFSSANDPGAEETTPSVPVTETGGRILILDDDRVTLEATAVLLSNWGWEIDAHTHLSPGDIKSLPAPDLIISDYDLGFGRTGLEVISEIRAIHGYIHALIITGSSTAITRQTVLDAGHVLLHKPVRPVQLRSAILGAII